ncbi:MAG: hypothetical protein AB7V32_04155 [Candidatus Berkiella sp.]
MAKYGASMDPVVTSETNVGDIIAECARCQQPFIVKYWDEELDWFIEINLTDYCRSCLDETNTTSNAK